MKIHRIGLIALIITVAILFSTVVTRDDARNAIQDQHITDLTNRVITEQGQNTTNLGAAGTEVPTIVALFNTSLASQITSSATSMTLTSGTDKAGNTLASSTYPFIIDEGSSSEEMVIADCTSTTCTNMIRGIDPVTGTSSVASLKKTHRRGASVKITDGPQLMILSRMMNGVGFLPNIIRYASHPSFTIGTQLVDKTYVDGGVLAGAATSSETVTGIVRLATQLQMASSTDTTPNTPLVLYTKYATSSPGTAGLWAVITRNSGKIAQAFLDLTEAFTWAGAHIFNSTATFNSGIIFSDATTQTTAAISTFGGSGADGALTISSGTTNINLEGKNVFVKNYTSISITGTGKLTFTNPHANGTIIVLRSQGAVALTSSQAPMLDISSLGAQSSQVAGNVFIGAYSTTTTISINGTTCAATCSISGGAGGTGTATSTTIINGLNLRSIALATGGAGASGGANASATGKGGGALYIEAGTTWNFTTTGGISVAGGNGAAGDSSSGGNGGGAGGTFFAVYKTLTANSGTITVTGGSGGNAVTQVGGSGGNGATGNGNGGSGGNATAASGTAKAGGGGGSNYFMTANGTSGGNGTSGTEPGGGGGGASGFATTTQNYFF